MSLKRCGNHEMFLICFYRKDLFLNRWYDVILLIMNIWCRFYFRNSFSHYEAGGCANIKKNDAR